MGLRPGGSRNDWMGWLSCSFLWSIKTQPVNTLIKIISYWCIILLLNYQAEYSICRGERRFVICSCKSSIVNCEVKVEYVVRMGLLELVIAYRKTYVKKCADKTTFFSTSYNSCSFLNNGCLIWSEAVYSRWTSGQIGCYRIFRQSLGS